jgi:hypothetical protein
MNQKTTAHQERLIKIWGLDREWITVGGWTPFPVALTLQGQWHQSHLGELRFKGEVSGIKSLWKSEFEVSGQKCSFSWHWAVKFKLLDYGDKEGGRKWLNEEGERGSVYSLFRRNCWLSGCLIPDVTSHELAEWLSYGRDQRLTRSYLERIYNASALNRHEQ